MHGEARIEKYAYISTWLYTHVNMHVNLDSTYEGKRDILGGSILEMREMCSEKLTDHLEPRAVLVQNWVLSFHFLSWTNFLSPYGENLLLYAIKKA